MKVPLKSPIFPRPFLADDSVIIKVHAASVNPIDNILRAGYLKDMMPLSFPFVMGYDVSGVVTEVGKDVSAFKIGDEVYARPNQEDKGTVAEFARLKVAELALKSASPSHLEAASIPLVGLTAWQAFVEFAHLKKGPESPDPCGLWRRRHIGHSDGETFGRLCCDDR